MTKHYKRKQYIEANSRDSNGCNDLRKFFNKTERQRGKRECEEGLVDNSKNNISELRYQIEMQMSYDCYNREFEAVTQGKPYNCTCPNPDSWSEDEVLKWHGLKNE